MYCRNCGKQLPDGTRFCSQCGTTQATARDREPKPSVGFFDAIKLYFTHYADFSTRSRRSEYWWAVMAMSIIGTIISGVVPDFAWIWSLATLIPSIAIAVRRLHDIGKGGAWYLLNLIPVVGSIILLVWFCKDSTDDNQWGPNPKY